jgi:hypothetical protein
MQYSDQASVNTMTYVSRSYLDDPGDAPVWRYMNIEKLLSILLDHALFFPSGTTLAEFDRYEGQATSSEVNALGLESATVTELESKFNKPRRAQLFFNCWHMNDSESDAMWKLYVNGTGGVAIRSTITRLKRCFDNSPQDISLRRIRYINDEAGHFDHPLRRYMRKKSAFRHEQELRLTFYDEKREYSGHRGLSIPVNVSVLIESIVVSPRAESWLLPLVKNLVIKLGHEIEVRPSEGSAPLPTGPS